MSLDLDRESRRSLEFDELLDWIAGFARTAPGAERVRGLVPAVEAGEVRRELAEVEEVRAAVTRRGPLLPGSLPDPSAAARALSIDDLNLEPAMLRDLARVVLAAGNLRRSLRQVDTEMSPRLHALGFALPDLDDEASEVDRGIEPDGRIADHASRELKRIRDARAIVASRLRRRLEGYLREPGSGSGIRDDFITQRNGRYVIPVRTDAPHPVRGIVHATSSSGATRFVEPLESVELNNDLVRFAEEEQQEQIRILRRWSDAFRLRMDELSDLLESLATIDALQARALFAEETEAVSPTVSADGPLLLKAVRHPLLDRKLRESDRHAVPIDLALDPFDQVLVLSGPNTGGKTVALKTFGLTVLMAQSGIPVPGDEVRLPLYRQVRADIGDHQSIEADLSTFSAHLATVVEILEGALPPALILFDEIGTGTEPAEGAALAQSILEVLIGRDSTTIATTHLGALKAWSFTTDGACSAAMEFDTERLRPTYRIRMGMTGVSAGLDIAARLGLDPRIVARARETIGGEARRSEDYLNRLRDLTVDLERRADTLRVREEELEQQRLQDAEQAGRQAEKAVRELDRAVEGLDKLARREISEFRDERERRWAERRMEKLAGKLHAEKAKQRSALDPAGTAPSGPGWLGPDALSEGAEVWVTSLGKQGRVTRIRGDRVEVQLGRVGFTVARSDVRVREGNATAEASEEPRGKFRRIAAVDAGPEMDEAPQELILIGKRVVEALDELDRFLDAAAAAGRREVRVVHGHGTGRLRRAVREHVRGHVQVKSRRPGRETEGGDGATVVELK